MSDRIKSIPTNYNGVQMRSKLEARVAKLLDGYGIKWSYESEGLDCYGVWYLPDFYLVESRTFLEVKGVLDDEALIKVDALARAANGLAKSGEVCLPMDFLEDRAARLPRHVVLVEPHHVTNAEAGGRLRARYAPAFHGTFWGGGTGRYCLSPDDDQCEVTTCGACKVVSFMWWGGAWFCYACGAKDKPDRRVEKWSDL